jgi:SAM-dependent methyltransferase
MGTSGNNTLRARALRFLFGLLYKNRALYWLASTIPFAGQWRRWQRLVLPRLVGHDALEIGCGIGTLLADMAAAGYSCAAVDHSPQMVTATRARLRRHGLLASTPVHNSDAQALPFSDASFDSVVSTFPTEYIYDAATMREIGRVLRPGGRLIVVLSASLLPASLLLAPLVAVQALVYGRGSSGASGCAVARAAQAQLPFAAGGMEPRAECVRGPFWEAYILIGEKRASADYQTQ